MNIDDQDSMTALFKHDVKLDPLMQSLREAGLSDEQVSIMTPLPLSEQTSARVGVIPLYLVTISAGLIGLAVGIFFAGGTAAMYPLMTGGKPIVAMPVVGIISYETMMLLAIVTTFVTMIVGIRRAHRNVSEREPRIDDGHVALSILLPADLSGATIVKNLLQRAGALEVRHVHAAPSVQRDAAQSGRSAAAVLAMLCLLSAFSACSRDMQEQPSYQPQEMPRLHSPVGSVPRASRGVMAAGSEDERVVTGARLYRINCAHCHGMDGAGNGPASQYLKEKPANLLQPEVQTLPELTMYEIVTNGKALMPPFKGELSAEERRSVSAYVKSALPLQ
jgi:mono/diheme cytochrome c family protein